MNLVFIGFLKHAGLALAIGLGACINAGLLYFYLQKQKLFQLDSGWAVFLLKILGAVILLAIFLIFYRGDIGLWTSYSFLQKIQNLFILIIVGALIYFASLKIFGINLKALFKESHH